MSVNKVSLKASEVPVKSVTIFQSSTAEVTRLLTVELKSGTNVVEISGISDSADPSSPRIYGPADASVRVLDIVCRRPAPDAPPRPSAEVTALLAQSHALQSRWIVCQEEMGLLDSAARLATTPGSGVATDHAGLLAFVETFAQKKLAAHVEVRALDAQIAAVEEELRVVRSARKGEARTVVAASVFTEKEGVVDLRLTYLVSGVRWTPCYDLHVPMTDGQPSTDVSLRCCATVSQSTGEDWTNTTLTLSTATVQAQKQLSVPSITPLRIKLGTPPTVPRRRPPPPPPSSHPGNPREPPPPPPPPCGRYCNVPIVNHPPPMAAVPAPAPPPAQQAPSPTTADVSDWSDSESESDPVLVEPLVPQPPVQAAPTRTALSVAYSVPGVLSLPSDGQEHRVTFETLNLKAELHHECVPRKSEAVFVVATVGNTSACSLLAGPMSVFVNESFVSQTAIKGTQFIGTKESFRFVLGVDTALKATYRQYSTTEDQPQVCSSPRKVVVRSTTATIANQHTHAVTGLVVHDAIPLRNEAGKVAVTVRRPVGLAQAAVGEDVAVKLGEEQGGLAAKARWMKGVDGKGSEKEGLLEWECAIPAGKTIALETQWDVSAEDDEEWFEGPRHVVVVRDQ